MKSLSKNILNNLNYNHQSINFIYNINYLILSFIKMINNINDTILSNYIVSLQTILHKINNLYYIEFTSIKDHNLLLKQVNNYYNLLIFSNTIYQHIKTLPNISNIFIEIISSIYQLNKKYIKQHIDNLNIIINLSNDFNINYMIKNNISLNKSQALQNAQNFMQALVNINDSNLDSIDIINKALSQISSYSNINDIINNFLQDLNAMSSQEFLQYCNINLYNDDSGSILGKDAGGNKSYNLEDIVKENTINPLKYPNTPFTFKPFNYTMYGQFIDNVYFLFPPEIELSIEKQKTVKYLANWILPAALNTIKQAYNLDFNLSNNGLSNIYMTNKNQTILFSSMDISKDNNKFIPVFFDDSIYSPIKLNDDALALCISGYNPYLFEKNYYKMHWNTIIINSKYYEYIEDNNENGYSKIADEYLDLVLTHELVHALMKTNINKLVSQSLIINNIKINPFPIWFIEGMAELVIGIDNIRTKSILDVIKYPEKFKNVLLYNTSDNIEDHYSIGFIFLRYLFQFLS